MVTDTDTATSRIYRTVDVRPALLKGKVSGNGFRVVTDGRRLALWSGPQSVELFEIDGYDHDVRRQMWLVTLDGVETTFQKGGGCTCGKPWMKTPTDLALAGIG
jgi:hypothetical protein